MDGSALFSHHLLKWEKPEHLSKNGRSDEMMGNFEKAKKHRLYLRKAHSLLNSPPAVVS